jgi:hypothetical protein
MTSAIGAARGEMMPCAAEPVLQRRDPELGAAWDKMWPRAPTEGAAHGKLLRGCQQRISSRTAGRDHSTDCSVRSGGKGESGGAVPCRSA